MYIRAIEELGIVPTVGFTKDLIIQDQKLGDCSDWEKDLQSFSKVIAEQYVRTVLKRPLLSQVKRVSCRSDGKVCQVFFDDGTSIWVSYAKVPSYVITREAAGGKLRCEFNYQCTSGGQVVFDQRGKCRPS